MTKKNATAYVFLDTNAYLEFQDFDQIDWPKVLDYRRICLVLAPITFNELERFKYDQKSERRKSRSRRITKKLDQIMFSVRANEEGVVPGRPGVTLLALTDSPTISAYPGLDTNIADDQLIAAVLKFAADHPEIDSENIFLMGDDAGCLNKARVRNIRVSRLDDRFRLPDEPSAIEKELAQLKRELHDFRTKQPRLRLAILTDNRPVQELTTRIALLREPDAAVLDKLYTAEEQAIHWQLPKVDLLEKPAAEESDLAAARRAIANLGQYVAAGGVNTISQDEINRYQSERTEYLQSFKQHLMRLYVWEEGRHRSQRFVLTILNDGTVPATGVIIRFVVPDGIGIYRDKDTPKQPRTPRRPRTPRTQLQQIMETMSVSAVPFLPHTPFLSPDVDPDTAEPDITPYNSLLVEWTRRKVMHHVPMELTPLVLEFPRVDGEQEYEMKYQIVADNVPAPVEGLIRISVIGEEQSYDISRRIH